MISLKPHFYSLWVKTFSQTSTKNRADDKFEKDLKIFLIWHIFMAMFGYAKLTRSTSYRCLARNLPIRYVYKWLKNNSSLYMNINKISGFIRKKNSTYLEEIRETFFSESCMGITIILYGSQISFRNSFFFLFFIVGVKGELAAPGSSAK